MKFLGLNGFGDVDFDDLPPVEQKLEEESGVLAIVRLVKLYKGQLTIVALGPLTNLAMAIRLDPSIKEFVKDIHLMGGNFQGKVKLVHLKCRPIIYEYRLSAILQWRLFTLAKAIQEPSGTISIYLF